MEEEDFLNRVVGTSQSHALTYEAEQWAQSFAVTEPIRFLN